MSGRRRSIGRSGARLGVCLGFQAALVGCQAPGPTRAVETEPRLEAAADASAAGSRENARAADAPLKPIEPVRLTPVRLTKDTVVIDARRPFDFASSRLPRSVSLQWSDFTQRQAPGVLQADLFEAARRLARAGVGIDSEVVVVGYGTKGGGEEGRIAWMLRYLGIRRARFAAISAFPGPFTARQPAPVAEALEAATSSVIPSEPRPKSVPVWKPDLDERWIATRAEVAEAVDALARAGSKAGRDARPKVALLDVRADKPSGEDAGLPGAWIPWTSFVDEKGMPDCASASRALARARVAPDARVVAFDDFGVASGAVAVALRECGRPDAANYPGGARDWESRSP